MHVDYTAGPGVPAGARIMQHFRWLWREHLLLALFFFLVIFLLLLLAFVAAFARFHYLLQRVNETSRIDIVSNILLLLQKQLLQRVNEAARIYQVVLFFCVRDLAPRMSGLSICLTTTRRRLRIFLYGVCLGFSNLSINSSSSLHSR